MTVLATSPTAIRVLDMNIWNALGREGRGGSNCRWHQIYLQVRFVSQKPRRI